MTNGMNCCVSMGLVWMSFPILEGQGEAYDRHSDCYIRGAVH